jgi:homoserine kinase type II
MMLSDEAKNARLSNAEISTIWNIPPIISMTTPPTGTIHRIMLLSTNKANYVLRAYSYTQEEYPRIVAEHSISAYVRAHGLPAVAPLPLPSGETIMEHEGCFYALYPFAQGRQFLREQVTSPEISAAMGRCLGEVHQTLSAYSHAKVRQLSFALDPSITCSQIEKLEAAICENAHLDALDQQALAILTQRRNWLLTAPPVDLGPFLALEQQVIHGDYQETNLFFADENVSAILDWDNAYVAPRPWETVRTLHYVFGLDILPCQIFLNAYREVLPLSFEQLDIAAQAYGWIEAQNLWAYNCYYLDHDRRVLPFLYIGFTSFKDLWTERANSFR